MNSIKAIVQQMSNKELENISTFTIQGYINIQINNRELLLQLFHTYIKIKHNFNLARNRGKNRIKYRPLKMVSRKEEEKTRVLAFRCKKVSERCPANSSSPLSFLLSLSPSLSLSRLSIA